MGLTMDQQNRDKNQQREDDIKFLNETMRETKFWAGIGTIQGIAALVLIAVNPAIPVIAFLGIGAIVMIGRSLFPSIGASMAAYFGITSSNNKAKTPLPKNTMIASTVISVASLGFGISKLTGQWACGIVGPC